MLGGGIPEVVGDGDGDEKGDEESEEEGDGEDDEEGDGEGVPDRRGATSLECHLRIAFAPVENWWNRCVVRYHCSIEKGGELSEWLTACKRQSNAAIQSRSRPSTKKQQKQCIPVN